MNWLWELLLLTPGAAVRAFWWWREYKFGWVLPLICLILWSAGLGLWFVHLSPFWLSYILGMLLSWRSVPISRWVMKRALQEHRFVRWDATIKLKKAYAKLLNLCAAHPGQKVALNIVVEASDCFGFIQSTSPFVREDFRPNPRRFEDPTSGSRSGWFGMVFVSRDLADPKYLALGPEVEAAVSEFYYLFSMASNPGKVELA
jgi:hypothetical protein